MGQYKAKDANTTWPERGGNNERIVYHAVLVNVIDPITFDSGNVGEKWTIEVYNDQGKKQNIFESVVLPGATFKIAQLAKALGKSAEFKAETFQARDNIGANFGVNLVTEESAGFADRNKIRAYLPLANDAAIPKRAAQAVSAGANSAHSDDDSAAAADDDAPF